MNSFKGLRSPPLVTQNELTTPQIGQSRDYDSVGEFDFRRDVLTFLSTKGDQYSPPRGGNT
jgi:hypothetical protein